MWKNTKSVLLKMYLYNNLGDDMFLDMLVKRYPETTFIIIGDIDKSYEKRYRNLCIKRYGKSKIIIDKLVRHMFGIDLYFEREMKKNDAVVNLGGSIFMQKGNWKSLYKARYHSAKSGIPYFIIGANFGAFQDELFKKKYKKLFLVCKDVCFRDINSAMYFDGVKTVRYAPDILFGYPNIIDNMDKEKSLGISIINLDDNIRGNLRAKKEIYEAKILETILYFMKRGYNIKLYSFCEKQGDYKAIYRIVNKLGKCKESISIVRYKNFNINEFYNDFCTNEYLMSTRFHGIILGIRNRQKVFPLIYDEKIRNIVKEYNISNYCEISEIDTLNPQSIIETERFSDLKIKELKKESLNHFIVLDSFLKGKNYV